MERSSTCRSFGNGWEVSDCRIATEPNCFIQIGNIEYILLSTIVALQWSCMEGWGAAGQDEFLIPCSPYSPAVAAPPGHQILKFGYVWVPIGQRIYILSTPRRLVKVAESCSLFGVLCWWFWPPALLPQFWLKLLQTKVLYGHFFDSYNMVPSMLKYMPIYRGCKRCNASQPVSGELITWLMPHWPTKIQSSCPWPQTLP